MVVATLRSKSFQRAYVDKYLQTYAIVDRWERARVEKEQAEQTQGGLSMFIRSTTHTASWNDLRPQASRWRLSLLDDQRARKCRRTGWNRSHQPPDRRADIANRPERCVYQAVDRSFSRKSQRRTAVSLPGARQISLRVAGPLGQNRIAMAFAIAHTRCAVAARHRCRYAHDRARGSVG